MTVLRLHDYLTDLAPLRRVARAVRPDEFATDAFQQFVYDLKDTMCAYGGLGLAATQVDAAVPDGTVWRVFVMRQSPASYEIGTFCNAEILSRDAARWAQEGCLSFRSVPWMARAAGSVMVRAQDEDGRAHAGTDSGFTARILAHEAEHLDGKTMVDRMAHVEKARFLQRVRVTRRLVAVDERRRAVAST